MNKCILLLFKKIEKLNLKHEKTKKLILYFEIIINFNKIILFRLF